MKKIKDIIYDISMNEKWEDYKNAYNTLYFQGNKEESDFESIQAKMLKVLIEDEYPEVKDTEYLFVSTRSEYIDNMRFIKMYKKTKGITSQQRVKDLEEELEIMEKEYTCSFSLRDTNIHAWNYKSDEYDKFMEDRMGYAIDFIPITKLMNTPLSIPYPIEKNIPLEFIMAGFFWDISFDGLEDEEKEERLNEIKERLTNFDKENSETIKINLDDFN